MGRTGRQGSNTRIAPGQVRRMDDNKYRRRVKSRAGIDDPASEQNRGGLAIPVTTNLAPGILIDVFDHLQDHVAEGVVSPLKTGDGGGRLLPSEVGILVTVVYKPSTPVIVDSFMTLGECLHCPIRWPRHLVRESTREAQDNVADSPMFDPEAAPSNILDSSEEEYTTSTTIPEKHPPSPTRKLALPAEGSCSDVDSNDGPVENFECDHHDGLPPAQPSEQPYWMSPSNSAEQYGARKTPRGPRSGNKVTLESVQEAVRRSNCPRKCLSKISERVIWYYRYNAWKFSSYSQRRDWIWDRLSESRVRSQLPRAQFSMKMDGISVCHNCFALAVGYSASKIGALKRSLIKHEDLYLTRRSLVW